MMAALERAVNDAGRRAARRRPTGSLRGELLKYSEVLGVDFGMVAARARLIVQSRTHRLGAACSGA